MPIDAAEPQSAGWWLERLAKQLLDRKRQARFERLDSYYSGNPPLPVGAENARAAYAAFQRKARSNFAELIVDAVQDRMRIRAIRTAVDNDENGDQTAWAIYKRNRLKVHAKQVHEWFLTFGEAYVIIGTQNLGEGQTAALITPEDPRQVITENDPITGEAVAGLKVFHDDAGGEDVAYLYLPGKVYRASRRRPAANGKLTFSVRTWDWDEVAGGDAGKVLPLDTVCVVRFENKRAAGEFETHTDLLDRINHMLLQRMVIATMQAFRQRAVIGDLPETDDAGNAINYDEVLAADPGALWQLPEGIELWESGQADITPILSSVKDDVQHLAAVTRTPLHYFTPDAAAGSAEGASLQREGHVFKVEDRADRGEDGWVRVFSQALQIEGQTDRAALEGLSIEWAPSERFSLAEKASAAVQAKAADVPWRTRGAAIWQFTPDELDRQVTERADDVLTAALLAPPAA